MHKPSNTLQQVKEWLEKRSRFPFETMKKWDALYYIQQLETRLAQVERERDAAVTDICEASYILCRVCKHDAWPECKKGCNNLNENDICDCKFFEWRGVCEGNTKEE